MTPKRTILILTALAVLLALALFIIGLLTYPSETLIGIAIGLLMLAIPGYLARRTIRP